MSKFPYPGLRPFHREEADIFFGRDEQVDQLLERLGKSRFLAIVGPSGCGKSSLVQTGVLNALEAGFLASAGLRWRIATLRPGMRPLSTLARALLEQADLRPAQEAPEHSEAFLLATLRRGPLGLVEALDETPLPSDTNLLIVVDQFEEIFRYRAHYDRDEAEAFVALLLKSASRGVYVVITMRSDFLGDCARLKGLPEALNDSQFLTPRLTREQRREAIEGPARVFGGTVEPGLVNRLLNDMGADPDQLPLMQHALMRLWTLAGKRGEPVILTLDDYEAIGGLEEALSRHADEAFAELDEKQQNIAEILFRGLSERSPGKRDIRRPVTLEQMAAVAGVTWQQVEDVVEVFRRPERCFLTPPAGTPLTPDTIIDVSHESLLRQWQRLKEWVEDEAASAETYRRLLETARLWKQGRAALWGTPDLDVALDWRKRQQPNPAWADRYEGDFDLGIEFLEASETKRQEDEEAKEREFRERTLGLFESHLTHAALQAKVEDYAAARKTLAKSRELDADVPAERRHARNLLAWYVDLMGGEAEQVYQGPGPALDRVAISPNGRLLAAVGEKGTVALFEVDRGELLKQWRGHEGIVNDVVFDPQGKWLATGGDDGHIRFWSLPEGQSLRDWKAPAAVWALALSPDGKRLASGGTDDNVTLWDMQTGKQLQTLKGHQDSIRGLAFSPDGALLASAAYDRAIRLWDLKTGNSRPLEGHTAKVNFVTFHPDGKRLATGSSDKHIRLWEVESGKSTVLQGHENLVLGLTFIDAGRRLVSASRDRTLQIWDTDNGVALRVLQGHTASVSGVTAWGEQIFSVSNDGTFRHWSLHPEGAGGSMQMVDLPGEADSAAIAPDGSSVAVGFVDGGLRLYSLPDARLLWEQAKAHGVFITRLAFSPDGKQLASASHDHTAKLWQASTGQPVQTFSGHESSVYGIAFSPDGKSLATASFDGQIGLFTVGEEQGRFHSAHEGHVDSVTFDSTGRLLLSTDDDGAVLLWDLNTWPPTLLRDFPKARDGVTWAAFSPSDNAIASVGRGQPVRILNTHDGSLSQELVGHENTVYRAAFSPDGGQVATVSWDATVRFWDLKTGTELFTLRLPTFSGQPGPLWDFDFRCTPTGCWIAVPLTSGRLVLYRMEGIYED